MKCINKHAEQMPHPYANQQLFHQHIENIRSHLAKFKGSMIDPPNTIATGDGLDNPASIT